MRKPLCPRPLILGLACAASLALSGCGGGSEGIESSEAGRSALALSAQASNSNGADDALAADAPLLDQFAAADDGAATLEVQ
jgi:hypothetical protein